MTILPTFISVTTSSFDLAVAYSTGGPDALLDLIGEEDASALVWPDPEAASTKAAAEPTAPVVSVKRVPFPVFWALLAIAASFVMVLMVPSSRGALDLTCCIQCQTPHLVYSYPPLITRPLAQRIAIGGGCTPSQSFSGTKTYIRPTIRPAHEYSRPSPPRPDQPMTLPVACSPGKALPVPPCTPPR